MISAKAVADAINFAGVEGRVAVVSGPVLNSSNGVGGVVTLEDLRGLSSSKRISRSVRGGTPKRSRLHGGFVTLRDENRGVFRTTETVTASIGP